MNANEARALERQRINDVLESRMQSLYALFRNRIEWGLDEAMIHQELPDDIRQRLEKEGYTITVENGKTLIGW
jgi:hypothetical protein